LFEAAFRTIYSFQQLFEVAFQVILPIQQSKKQAKFSCTGSHFLAAAQILGGFG
jgi:hypothetical protein